METGLQEGRDCLPAIRGTQRLFSLKAASGQSAVVANMQKRTPTALWAAGVLGIHLRRLPG